MKVLLILSTCAFLAWGKPSNVQEISRSTIVGGEDAEPGEFPYQISVKVIQQHKVSHHCGGSIYSNLWVITAAHCGYHQNYLHLLKVVAGEHNLKEKDGNEQERNVVKAINHEAYVNDGRYHNDIALLKLETPFDFNDRVSPIPLPYFGQSLTGECTVTGWGRLFFGGSLPDILQKVNVSIIPDNICRKHTDYRPLQITDSMMCAGYMQGGKDSCQGDSGGPLNCGGVLGGIVSWGKRCGERYRPGVYTEVSYFVNWIQEKTQNY